MPAELDPELLAFFRDEATGYLPPLAETVALEDPASPDLHAAHRHAHSIKGSAAMLGIHDLSVMAKHLEDRLEDVARGRTPWSATASMARGTVALLDQALNNLEPENLATPAELQAVEELVAAMPPRPAVLDDEDETDEHHFSEHESDPGSHDAWREERADSAATNAEEIPAELLEVFALEADEHLRAIHAALPVLHANPGDKEAVQAIRRAAHTLKGAAGMVGFRAITKLAHRMEDVLDRAYESAGPVPASVIPVLARSADALTDLAAGTGDPAVAAELYAEYDAALAAFGSDVVATAPAADPTAVDDEVAAQLAAAARRAGQSVRVPIARLDEITKLVGELVSARAAFEQRAVDYARMLEELQLSAARLKRCSARLETEYETRALANRAPAGAGVGASVGGGDGGFRAPKAETPYGFDDLEFDRYTEFHLLTRELAETTTDVQTIGTEVGHLFNEIDGFLSRKARLTSDIQDRLMRTRMLPLSTLAAQLHRTVRTVATDRGKDAQLVFDGERTELDKVVLEELSEPLLHLLRNAVDHGLEAPAARVAMGKSATGTIRIGAFQEGTQVVLQVSDDGGGIDLDRVRTKAVFNGLVSPAEADSFTENEVYDLLFRPGFSTAAEVSEVSGRGVGLDIVRAKVEKLKGTLVVTSTPGEGTTFTVRLPLTLAVTKALLVAAGGQTFAIPLAAVDLVVRMDEAPEEVAGQRVFRAGDDVHPLITLSGALHLPEHLPARPPVLVVNAGGERVAVAVEAVLGGREVVVKDLGTYLKAPRGVSGSTILGNGTVALILNPADLAPSRLMPATPSLPRRLVLAPDRPLTVLVVDDSPSVRRVVASLMKSSGFHELTAKDGQDALEVLTRLQTPPDIILSDIEMPRMDGYELLATVRHHDQFKKIPVVMITSRAGDKHRNKALDLGASGYLVKPYQDDALLALIRRLTARR